MDNQNVQTSSFESISIEDQIRNGQVVTKEIIESAAQKIADERKEKLTNELIRITLDAEFSTKSSLLELKKNRKIEDLSKQHLNKTSQLEKDLHAGTISTTEYREKLQKIESEFKDNKREIEKNYAKLLNDLRSQVYNWF